MGLPAAPAALANNTAATILGGSAFQSADTQGMLITCRVAATGAFRLNLLTSADGGTTNYVVKQVSSGTITVDGATANYTNAAELAGIPMGAINQVQIYNGSGASINWVSDWRVHRNF